MKNPFTGWTTAQQCQQAYARDGRGFSTDPCDPEVVCWCAAGRLLAQGVTADVEDSFRTFLFNETACDLTELNDQCGWQPWRFRKAWTAFQRQVRP
jgi:hypothetical protein